VQRSLRDRRDQRVVLGAAVGRYSLRILHVLNHTNRLNGHVHAAVDLACAQVELGHQVAICSGGGTFDALLAENGVETFIIDQSRKPLTIVRATTALMKLIRRWRADVVHAHMMTSALLSLPGCRLSRVPLVTTVHNEFEKSAILMGVGNRVIAVSHAVGQSMRKRGIPQSRLRVVLNGTIGVARLKKLDRTPQPLSSPAIVFVGGLHPRKGVSDLLDAFAIVRQRHPGVHLTVVGEGPHAAEYRAAAQPIADAVTFVGPQDNPRSYLLAADIFVLPSHSDPAPLVISEAREAGCAIVATAVDGIPELLNGGRSGILVPPRDPAALADAISSLLADPGHLATWRNNSQIEIEELTIERVAADTLRVYREITRVRHSEPVGAAHQHY